MLKITWEGYTMQPSCAGYRVICYKPCIHVKNYTRLTVHCKRACNPLIYNGFEATPAGPL